MDKLNMQSKNIVDENIEKVKALFPNCVTEGRNEKGELVKMIDFDLLKQELSHIVVEGEQERYTMTWPDKKQAILTANAPINKTLRPCREESVGKDGVAGEFDSENLYIEGDNLDVLKLLRETYLGKIKMIYIDPPYNTGNDFVYNDDFAEDSESFIARSGQKDEEGNRLVLNNDSNGRFHTDWLNMIYPRLKLARDLLTRDGMIFISIDENEVTNLKKVCDEIFGAQNFLLNICVNRTSEIASNFTIFKHEYALVYLKNISDFNLTTVEKYSVSRGTVGNKDQTMPIIEFPAGLSCKNIADGIYTETRKIEGSSENIENLDPIIVENGKLKYPVKLKARWRSSNDMRNFFSNNCEPTPAKINGEVVEIYFENDRFNPQIKKKTYEKIPSMYLDNKRGSEDIKKLDMEQMFSFPKSVQFIKYILTFTHKNDIIMDFFSGSATTAHATMQLNAEDGGNRKFIMVQLPEECNEKSDAFESGYNTICKLGEERLRRAGKKIKEETNANIDYGFRVLKLDESCMKDVYYNPDQISQSLLDKLESNIKEDRTPEDLLFQVMLDMGVLLSSEIQVIDIKGKKVFNVNDGNLVCCFDEKLTDEVVTEIAKMKPLYAVMRDSSMSSDSVNVNFDQIFETYSPNTTRKVL